MINTIIQGRMLVFVQQVNVLLYYVRKLPLVGEKIPYRLYGETDIKKAIGAIPVVFSVIGAFVGTFLYFLLMIKLPANWIQGFWEKEGIFVDQKAVMVYLFLIFSFLPGSFLVSNLTEGAKKDYVLLHVMRIPAAQHYRSKDGTKRSERYHLLFSTAIVVWIWSGICVVCCIIVFYTIHWACRNFTTLSTFREKREKSILEIFRKNIFNVWNHISTRIWSGGSSPKVVF